MTWAIADAKDEVVISRISEQLQPDAELMHRLDMAGMRPGRRVRVAVVRGVVEPAAVRVAAGPQGVEVWVEGGEHATFDRVVADHVFVRVA